MNKNKISRVRKPSGGKPKPLTGKAGVTRDGKRRYGCGGKLKK